ncbi:MAG TPA: RNA polymerase sigma factor RpoD [bacterium]|nr:RNA polymerase sigma factor RpoD [bacterium]HEX67501.1 RNA polymerase sigma factor RpoD [bacterium]
MKKLDQKIKKLVTEGKKKGHLTYDEINDLLPEEVSSPEDIDRVLTTLGELDIPIVSSPKELALRSRPSPTKALETERPREYDAVRSYLYQMGKIPLLTREEEIALSKAIEEGRETLKKLFRQIIPKDKLKELLEEKKITDLVKEVKRVYKTRTESPFPKEEELPYPVDWKKFEELLPQIEEAESKVEKAKKKMIESNLRLVVSIAKKYINRGLSFLDLIQEGNIGLMRAVEKFEYKRGFKFSTYATWWIRQAITRAIADQARTIRIPVHMIETMNKLLKISQNFVQEHGREPTAEELAKLMNLPVEKVRGILKISQHPISLETPVGSDEDTHFGDFIEDETAEQPLDSAAFQMLKEQIEEVLETLPERERDILKLRFGIGETTPHTLEEVGKKFNVTRERVRQIEAKALKKLRHPARSKKLRGHLE